MKKNIQVVLVLILGGIFFQASAQCAVFLDDFSTDTRAEYPLTNTWTKGGVGSLLYDAVGERIQAIAGDDIAFYFSHALPSSPSGSFSIDFLPTVTYPPAGRCIIRLMQDSLNYYEVHNTDGAGPNKIRKVVNGQEAESTYFQSEYNQNISYHITINFSAASTSVTAFGETHTLNGDAGSITVNSFEVETVQQEAYYDNILYSTGGSNTAPVVSILSPANGSSVNEGASITFTGTATDIEDGNISSNLSWSSNLDGVIGSGATFSTSLLSVGMHTINTSVMDSGGLPGLAAISVTIDSFPSVSYYCDGDVDGFRSSIVSGTCTGAGCEPSGCQTVAGDDCNDGNTAIHPGAAEICDGVDNDCNVATADGSGEIAPSNSNQQGVCSGSSQSCSGGDWIDNYLSVANYETVEVSCADGMDNDCDSSSDGADFDCSAPSVSVVDVRVSAISDDAEETVSSGKMLVKNSDLELTFDGTPQAVGLRFTDIDIPQGALIQNAYVQFQVDETSSEATSLMIRGQAIDNAPTFAGGVVGDITSRAVTASGISWNPPAWNTVGAAGSEQQTPDIKNVIQEIVDRPGWSSGNSLAIILTGTGKRVAESFDGSQSGAPLLHVEYGTGLQLVNYYCDGDGDGFRSLIVSGTCTGSGCEPSGCQSVAGNDCNDGNVAINPGAPELCDGLDNDCNVATADGSGEVAPSNSNQQGVCSGSSQSCSGGAWADNYLYVTNYETVEGSCADGLDNDCDGSSDDADLDCTAVLAIFDIQVSASSDDAEETVSTGQMLVKNSDLELAFDGTPQAVGLRFTDIDIPQGALIQNAYVQFQVDETSSEATSLMIRGQVIDNAPTFAGGVVGDITSRAVTASGIFWNPPAWNTVGAAGSEQQTPDIKNVIQEIVNLPGWSNGNSLAIILTGTGKRVAESFDGSQSGAPLLHVEYIAGAASVCAGNCYVAMGDSITYGISDDIAADGIGYTPILSDLLGGSSTIANEGVPGDKSIDGISDVSAILIRNPNASLFLVQYGTNDAQISSPLPSGLGCSGAACSGTFKGNMLQIIDAINNEGKEVALAKIPIALAGCTTCSYYTDPSVGQKNIIIQGYNEVIDELVNDPANNIVVIPPDFYAYFSEFDSVTGRFRYEDEYGDWVHPNGIGYQSMADLWFQVLTQ